MHRYTVVQTFFFLISFLLLAYVHMCLCASGRAVHTDSGGEPRDPAQYVVLGDLPAASRSRTFFF